MEREMHARNADGRRRVKLGRTVAAVASATLAVAVAAVLRPELPAADTRRAGSAAGVRLDAAAPSSRPDDSADSRPAWSGAAAVADDAKRDATVAPDPGGTRIEERPLEDLVAQAEGGATTEERVAAVDAIAYAAQGDPGRSGYAEWVLTQALADSDERIRARALTTLKDTADAIPVQAVEQVMRDDRSPDLRIQALELLVERAGEQAHDALRLALSDPEASVRDRANELVEDLHIALDGA
jgi:hypothetical protein